MVVELHALFLMTTCLVNKFKKMSMQCGKIVLFKSV